MEGFPDKYVLFPKIERVKEVAQRFGMFLLPQTTDLRLSNHIKHEPTDGEAIQPQLPFEV